ncbi:MAG TPA: LuxR C-terminal-related transcriptional regulator [Thermoanaerobaculia bacterium]|nr:LuxR C-terminal-related transcriptional regulator [Thermoanaerobaculia bacterium]
MAQLSAKDLRAALDFVGEAHSFEDLDSFRNGILPGLERLIPSDLVGYNEVYSSSEPALVITHPEPMLEFASETLARLAHQHPLVLMQVNGDNRTYKISDFLSRRQFHSLELYHELYRRIGAEDQIAFGLPGPVVIGIAMNRGRRDFSERDRAMLDLMRPHLARAHGRILERMRMDTLIAALELGLEQGGGVLALDSRGGIAAASSSTTELLRAHFPDQRGASLPAEIAEWLEGDPGATNRDPLTVGGEQGRLSVREAPTGALDATVLILKEARPLTPASLLGLGLTHRQAEVLCLLAAGKGTGEIGEALFISPRTVRKHFEHIYERLGVHSRAAAVSAALEAATPSASPKRGVVDSSE